MEKSLESGGDLLKTREYTPVMFEETKQTRNVVPRFVEFLVIETWDGTVLFRRHDAGRALLTYVRHDRIRIIAFVRQEGFIGFILS